MLAQASFAAASDNAYITVAQYKAVSWPIPLNETTSTDDRVDASWAIEYGCKLRSIQNCVVFRYCCFVSPAESAVLSRFVECLR